MHCTIEIVRNEYLLGIPSLSGERIHEVRIPTDRPDILQSILLARSNMRPETQKIATPASPTQAQINEMLKAFKNQREAAAVADGKRLAEELGIDLSL